MSITDAAIAPTVSAGGGGMDLLDLNDEPSSSSPTATVTVVPKAVLVTPTNGQGVSLRGLISSRSGQPVLEVRTPIFISVVFRMNNADRVDKSRPDPIIVVRNSIQQVFLWSCPYPAANCSATANCKQFYSHAYAAFRSKSADGSSGRPQPGSSSCYQEYYHQYVQSTHRTKCRLGMSCAQTMYFTSKSLSRWSACCSRTG
jgi:hypothetical protein